jgi:hypothetical protein
MFNFYFFLDVSWKITIQNSRWETTVGQIVHWHMSTRSPYSLMKIYKHFLKDLQLKKKCFHAQKFKMAVNFKISKLIILQKKWKKRSIILNSAAILKFCAWKHFFFIFCLIFDPRNVIVRETLQTWS